MNYFSFVRDGQEQDKGLTLIPTIYMDVCHEECTIGQETGKRDHIRAPNNTKIKIYKTSCTLAQRFLAFSAVKVACGALKILDAQATSQTKYIRVPWGRTLISQAVEASVSTLLPKV